MNQNQAPLSPEEAIPRIAALLAQGKSCRITVTGTSMLPFLRHKRDAVLLAPLDGEIRVGDILFYLRAPGKPILHRVHALRPDGMLVLCGDAQTWLEPVRREQVLGRASYVERDGKPIDCRARSLRMLVALWRWLRPVRPYFLAVLRRIRAVQ